MASVVRTLIVVATTAVGVAGGLYIFSKYLAPAAGGNQ